MSTCLCPAADPKDLPTEKVQPLSPSSYSPSIPRGSRGALAVLAELCSLFHAPPHWGILVSALAQLSQYSRALCCRGRAKPNTQHHVPRAPEPRCLSPGALASPLTGGAGAVPSPHRGTREFRLGSAQALAHGVSSAAPGSGSRPSITRQHAEPPEKPHQQVKDKPLAFSGLKLSH